MRVKRSILIGNGGHAKVLRNILTLNNVELTGIIDISNSQNDEQYLGDDEWFANNAETYKDYNLINGVGSTQNTDQRQSVFEEYKALGFTFMPLIHPKAIIADDCEIEEGAQIMAGCVIQPGCTIAANTIINTSTSIDHDCIIGAHTHIAPGCTLSGSIKVGRSCHIGAGSVLIQSLNIGNNVLTAAGSVVIEDIADNNTVMGAPAKLRV